MSGTALVLLVLKTSRLDSMRDFYASLGIEFVRERHGSGPSHWAGKVGDLVLEIYPLPEGIAVPDATTRLGFVVDDLRGTLEEVGSSPTPESQMTEWGERALVRDPDGRAVELYQRRTPDRLSEG